MKALNQIIEAISSNRLPPVEQWHPDYCGDIDIKILRDGTWLHEGQPIKRLPMVKMFSNILVLENGEYFLVTPVEKMKISVECTPFVITDEELIDDTWVFTNNLGEKQLLDDTHPLNADDEECPVVVWRRNLLARISGNVMYRLQTHALNNNGLIEDVLWLSSGNSKFQLGHL